MQRMMCVCLLVGVAAAQAPAPADLQGIVTAQFGKSFTLYKVGKGQVASAIEKELAEMPLLTGDLNEDGVEDAVILGRSDEPLVHAKEFHYRVMDPHHAYFGFGDPNITQQFSLQDPDRARLILVIHGAGTDAWRAANPLAKFVLINVPFDRLAVKQMMLKKKSRWVISAEDTANVTSAVYFDAKKKKYKWEPMAAN